MMSSLRWLGLAAVVVAGLLCATRAHYGPLAPGSVIACIGDGDRELEAGAFVGRDECHAPAVGFGNRLHDGQSERTTGGFSACEHPVAVGECDNAVRFTSAEDTIRIGARAHGGQAIMWGEAPAPGVVTADRHRVTPATLHLAAAPECVLRTLSASSYGSAAAPPGGLSDG